jgi:predicted nucleic acid-binding Zn ribbon protein
MPPPILPTTRTTRATPMKEAIEAFLKAYNLKGKFNETYLVAFWERMMGKTIANHTQQLYVKDKTLFLKLDSAPLRQELYMAQSKVIELINKDVGERVVEEVIFL